MKNSPLQSIESGNQQYSIYLFCKKNYKDETSTVVYDVFFDLHLTLTSKL